MAFEKVRKGVNIPGIKLVLITEEYYRMALDFVRDNFVKEEPLNKSLGVIWTSEEERFWLSSFKFNHSLMFINEENGDPVAIRTTRIATRDDRIDIDSIQTPSLKELLLYTSYCDDQADFFGHFQTYEAFHFLGLSVNDKYKNRGLATKLFNAAIEMIRNFGINPVYIKGEASSNFSKRVYANAGFEELYDKPFAEWEVDGRHPIQNTGENTSMKALGLRVKPK